MGNKNSSNKINKSDKSSILDKSADNINNSVIEQLKDAFANNNLSKIKTILEIEYKK